MATSLLGFVTYQLSPGFGLMFLGTLAASLIHLIREWLLSRRSEYLLFDDHRFRMVLRGRLREYWWSEVTFADQAGIILGGPFIPRTDDDRQYRFHERRFMLTMAALTQSYRDFIRQARERQKLKHNTILMSGEFGKPD